MPAPSRVGTFNVDPNIAKYTEDSDSDIENSAVPIAPTASKKRHPSAAAQRAAADSASGSDSEGSLQAGGHAPPADVSDADSDGSSEPAAILGSDAYSATRNDDATSSSASDDTRADSDSDW